MTDTTTSSNGPSESTMAPVESAVEIERLRLRLSEVRSALLAATQLAAGALATCDPAWSKSARNLVHYLALRGIDMRDLQRALARCGLSSLGRSEGHVLWSIDAVLGVLHRLGGLGRPEPTAEAVPDYDEGSALLAQHTLALFGRVRPERQVKIMVTMPREAADDLAFVRSLIAAGMDCMRINCAHDDPDVWRRMAANLRTAAQESGVDCTIEFDLPGPKIRTGPMPPGVSAIELRVGDVVRVDRQPPEDPGGSPRDPGRVVRPHDGASLCCTLPIVFSSVRKGHSIWFDDGKAGGSIESVDERGLVVRVTSAKPEGTKIRADKGINLPDTELPIPALDKDDLAALDVAAECADMVALSFARSAEDVELLRRELAARGAERLGVVLKIETRAGFERLPSMLLGAMRGPRVGVMIARGDLAVECGFERLAEVQEEILWICEAAHVPVVWATQVLETLAKKGLPTRAEVTDAAMGQRAECVMLNKGPHVVSAVRALAGILGRMQAHQHKKTAMLRRLVSPSLRP